MSTTAKTFRNRENYAKYLALYFEPGVTVLLTTLQWCYKGQLPIEKHLADLGATNSLRKTNIINANEQKTFEELKEGKIELNNLDVTILYKVIQLTCDLLPRNNNVWTKDCPTAQQGELEFLLFRLKDGRNKLAHPHDEQKNITESMVGHKCKEMKDLLTKILQASAFKGRIPPVKLREVLVHTLDDVQRISSGDNVCDSMRQHTINLILADLKSKAFFNDEIKSSLKNEIEEYSSPSLESNGDFHPLKDILRLNKSPVIVVKGEAGRGKTTMSRFIYYSWLSGNTNPVEGISLFDVVLRVECNRTFSSDINMFYETLFPNASFAFPNTNSFKKSLDEFRVFWIMDGFDECTAEFKGFLTAMTYSLSDKHNLLITTRPNIYEDLNDILCKSKLSVTSLTLGLLQDHNMKEIIQNLIIDDKNKEAFKKNYNSLDDVAKCLLTNPLNLNLYIKLWLQDTKLVLNTFSTKMLFLKTTSNNLTLLKKRLSLSTELFKEDLEVHVDNWFYGSLCKQSFLMLREERYHIIDSEFLKILKKNALKPSTYLSTFLVQEEENDGVSDEENEVKIRYKYHHLTQQYVLASLFLKHFKEYDGESVVNGTSLFKSSELIKFYVEMVNEDGSLDANFAEVFSPIQLLINFQNFFGKQGLLYDTSVAANFNTNFMKKISHAFKGLPCLDLSKCEYHFPETFSFTNFVKFLEFVKPKKISIDYLDEYTWVEGFQSLIDFLIKFKTEIDFKGSFHRDKDFSPTLLGTDLNVIELSDNRRRKFVKYIHKGRESRDLHEFSYFCESLWQPENQAFEQLEIWIKFDRYCMLTDCIVNIFSLPKEIVELTILGIEYEENDGKSYKPYIEKEDFEAVLEFLAKIKGDKTLKFKALHLPFFAFIDPEPPRYLRREIRDADKQRLKEIAHSVTNDSYYQWRKFCVGQFKDVNLNQTDFDGTMDGLDFLSNHHANLKTINLNILSEDEFFRMLTFLHNNKTSLSEVTLDFSYMRQERKCILDKIRVLPNDFTIPNELVQHTSIKIGCKLFENNFQDYFAFLKHVKGDETLKFKYIIHHNHDYFTSKQRKMFLHQITSKFCNKFGGGHSIIDKLRHKFSTNESDGSDESDESDGSDGSDESDESDGSDGSDESDESDGSDGSDESDESDGSDGSDESDESDGSDERSATIVRKLMKKLMHKSD